MNSISNLDLFFLGTSLVGLLAVFILLKANRDRVLSSRLLAGMIFCFSFLLFHLTIIHTGWILQHPWLFRLSSPTSYLIAPLSFLYVQSIVKQRERLRWIDAVHALPFLLHLAELAPFLVMDLEAKREYTARIVQDPELVAQLNEGLLPAYGHQVLKASLAVLYLIAQWQLILPLYRKPDGQATLSKAVRDWLAVETGLLCLLSLLVLISGLVRHIGLDTQRYVTSIVASLYFVLLMYLFLKPEVLYGMPDEGQVSGRPGQEPRLKPRPANLKDHLEKIDCYLDSAKPFLRQGFSLPEMAKDLNMSRHHLSSTINKGYGVNFSELINRKRIEYAQSELDPETWQALSIDGIAHEVGFNSRFTFSKVFKQVTGRSPSEYRKEVIEY